MSSRPSRGAARLAAILDALPDALLLVDTNGTVVAANRVALETFERPGAAVVGRGLLDLLPEFDPQLIPGSMRRPRGDSTASVAPGSGLRPEERTKPLRMAARRTDGSDFPAEVTSADLEDGPGGESPYAPGHHYTGDELLMLVVRDLTGSAEIEAELHRQRRQTEMILRAAAEGIVGTDTTGKVVLVNPSAAQILGYRASELGGADLHPLIHHSRPDGTSLPYEETPIADTLRSGRKHRVRGQVLWGRDGQPVPVDMTTAPVRDGDQLVGAVLAFTDRRRRDALEARLAQLQAVLDVALRGPLDTLRAELNTLVDDPAGQLWPEANQTLRHLSAGYGRMTALVDSVLDFQRLDSGRERLAVGPVNLEDVVHAATEGADELIGPGRAQFVVHAPQLEIEADGRWLALALAHLIAEVAGVDATGQRTAGASDAPVVVAAARRGDVVRIEVQGPRGAAGAAPAGSGSRGAGASGDAGSVHEPLARGVALLHGGILQTHEVPGQSGSAYLLEVPVQAAGPAARAARGRETSGRGRETGNETTVMPGAEPPERAGSGRGAAGEPGGRTGGLPADAGEPGELAGPGGIDGPGGSAGSAGAAGAVESGGGTAGGGASGGGRTGGGRRRRAAPAAESGGAAGTPAHGTGVGGTGTGRRRRGATPAAGVPAGAGAAGAAGPAEDVAAAAGVPPGHGADGGAGHGAPHGASAPEAVGGVAGQAAPGGPAPAHETNGAGGRRRRGAPDDGQGAYDGARGVPAPEAVAGGARDETGAGAGRAAVGGTGGAGEGGAVDTGAAAVGHALPGTQGRGRRRRPVGQGPGSQAQQDRAEPGEPSAGARRRPVGRGPAGPEGPAGPGGPGGPRGPVGPEAPGGQGEPGGFEGPDAPRGPGGHGGPGGPGGYGGPGEPEGPEDPAGPGGPIGPGGSGGPGGPGGRGGPGGQAGPGGPGAPGGPVGPAAPGGPGGRVGPAGPGPMAPGGPTAHTGGGVRMDHGQAGPADGRTGRAPGGVEPLEPAEYDEAGPGYAAGPGEYDDDGGRGPAPRGRTPGGHPRPGYTAGPGAYEPPAAPGRGPSGGRGDRDGYADPDGPVGEYDDPAAPGARTRGNPGAYAGRGDPATGAYDDDPATPGHGRPRPHAGPGSYPGPGGPADDGPYDAAGPARAPRGPARGAGAGPVRNAGPVDPGDYDDYDDPATAGRLEPADPAGRRPGPANPAALPAAQNSAAPQLPQGATDAPVRNAPGAPVPPSGRRRRPAAPAEAPPDAPALPAGERRRPGPPAQEPDTGPYPHSQGPGGYDEAPPPYAAPGPRRATGRPVQDPDTGPYPHDGNRAAAGDDDTGEVRTVRTSQTPHPAHGAPDTRHPRRGGDPAPAVPAQHGPRTQGDDRAQGDPRPQHAQSDPRTQGGVPRQPGPQAPAPGAQPAAQAPAAGAHASGHTPGPVDPRHEMQTPARGVDPRRAAPRQDQPADAPAAQAAPADAPGPRPAATGSTPTGSAPTTSTRGGATRFARSAATPAMPALPAQQSGPISVRTLGQGVAYVDQPSGPSSPEGPPSQGGRGLRDAGRETHDDPGTGGQDPRNGRGTQDGAQGAQRPPGSTPTGTGPGAHPGHDPHDPYDPAHDSAYDPYAAAGDPVHAPTHDPYDSADEHTGARRRRLGGGSPADGTPPPGGDAPPAAAPPQSAHAQHPHAPQQHTPQHRPPARPGTAARRDAIGRAFAIGAPDASAAEGPEPLDGRHGVVEVAAQDPETTPLRLDDEMPPEPLDNPRRLLVWPEPDAATQQALTARNYRPVVVHSREELDAQISVSPAGLFVDPLTGPITRTALQSLRKAAVAASVPVLVTAGLGQATREAAYGADPAVLLKALAPRDSEQHPPRVLLFEENPDIADALAATLERRGMQVMHATSDEAAVDLATRFRPNLVVMDLMRIRRRRTGIVDWLNANGMLNRMPMVVYTAVDINRAELPRLRSGETVLFLAERSTSAEVQNRIVDLLAKIGTT